MASEPRRPQRKRVRKLTDEEIHAILQSESESSDVDDPDFVNEDFLDGAKSPEAKKRVPPRQTPAVSKTPEVTRTPTVPPTVQLVEEQKPVAVLKPSSTPAIAPATPTKDGQGSCYKCCVKNCVSGNLSDKDGLWLFPLPTSPATLAAWEAQLPIDRDQNRPLSPRVCFRHFDKADFIRKQQRFVGLREGAVPKTAAPKPVPPSEHGRGSSVPAEIVRPMPVGCRIGTPGHRELPLNPVIPRPLPQTLRPASFVPEEPTTNGAILPDTPEFLARNSRTVTADPDEALELLEIKIEPMDRPAEDEEGADGPLYSLTLEDVQEELPWVVPDSSWRSDMEGDVLVISKEGRTGVTKRVVIRDGLAVTVYVAGKEAEGFEGATLGSADDLRVILERVDKLQ